VKPQAPVEWGGRRRRRLRGRVYFIGTYLGHQDDDEQAIQAGDGDASAVVQATKGTSRKATRNEKETK
jgi:hypothetical protein